MNSPVSRIASCSCGQLSVHVSGQPRVVGVCHCLACQRRTGSVFAVQAVFPRSAARIEGVSTEFVRVGDEGTRITFRFCPQCGATLFHTAADREDSLAIPVGAFADPLFPKPTSSVYKERMHSWVCMPDGIQHIP